MPKRRVKAPDNLSKTDPMVSYSEFRHLGVAVRYAEGQ